MGWLVLLAFVANLPATTEPRFRLESAIAPTYLHGNPREVATITRQTLTATELETEQRAHFTLKLRNFAELNARINRGEILSLKEMAERYFPLPETWRKVARWAAAQGLAVEESDPSCLTVAAYGSVSRVESALQMRFARVRGTDDREYTSAVSAPAIPGEFRDCIVSVLQLQPHLQPRPHQITDLKQLDAGYILPQTFAQLYHATNLGVDGTGQTIAIMGSNPINPDDLTAFWLACGLPTTIAQFTEIDLSSPGDNNHAGEVTMDVEWASAMAPGANLVYISSLSIDVVSAWIISQRSAGRMINQLSSSYGLPEATHTAPAAIREADNQYYASLAALGVSIFIASGDDGSTQMVINGVQPVRGYDPAGTASPLYPASSPYVTGVGGTTVAFQQQGNSRTAALPVQEGAWSLPWRPLPPPLTLAGMRASGGGVSLYFSRPAWQTGSAIPAGTMRCVPDVAAVASCNFSPFMYFRAQRLIANGTSVSAPIWAGLCALINQARSNRNLAPLGLLGPRIYPLNGTAAFNQMTTGSQSGGDGFTTAATNGAYMVGPNYNLISGLGSPNVGELIAALTVPEVSPLPTPDPTPTPTPTPTPAPVPTPAPAASSGGGGGGAPSGWFLATLGLLLAIRLKSRRG